RWRVQGRLRPHPERTVRRPYQQAPVLQTRTGPRSRLLTNRKHVFACKEAEILSHAWRWRKTGGGIRDDKTELGKILPLPEGEGNQIFRNLPSEPSSRYWGTRTSFLPSPATWPMK